MNHDRRLAKLSQQAARAKVLATINAKLRRFELDRAWLQANPKYFTIIKAAQVLESLRLWTVALRAVRKAA